MHNKKQRFAEFNNFRRQINNRAFFVEKTSGIFGQHNEFRVKSYFIPPVEDKDINLFFWNLSLLMCWDFFYKTVL